MKQSMPALALALVATAVGSAAPIDHASAQPAPAWPSKPIRLIVPFAAGGNVDLTARLVAPAMADTLGQPIVVENRTGAGGMVGAEVVAKAAPDGYVLLTGSNSTFSVVPALYPNAPYNPVRDFTPLTLAVSYVNILVINPAHPAKNVAELIEFAKAYGINRGARIRDWDEDGNLIPEREPMRAAA